MVQVLVIWEEILFYKNLDKEDALFYQYNRSRILLNEHFGNIKKFRVYSLITFALVLPLLAILFTASGLLDLAILTLIFTTVGALVSELSGRYLFYRTVVPLGLAGNFFAGNQRG
jgi:DMSO reductase anchor subunit